MTVVTANLREAWDYNDVQSHWDMNKFVRRVTKQPKFLPDVLAVQEIRRSSALYVARRLTARTNRRFRVVVMPPVNPAQRHPSGRSSTYENTIIANMSTMRILHDGGYTPTSARRDHMIEPGDPIFFQSFALLQKRSSGEKYAVTSLHFYPRWFFSSADLDKYYRNKWVNQLRSLLYKRYGGRKNVKYLIVGDFNQTVCLRRYQSRCFKPSPFARTLRRAGYQNTSKNIGWVDLIWAKNKRGALHSWDGGLKGMSAPYSDHAFRWTVLGPDRYAPTSPKPVSLDLRRGGSGRPFVDVKWEPSDDRAGSGLKAYDLQRSLNGGAWTSQTPFNPTWHQDRELEWGDTVSYKLRAVDRAGNATPYIVRRVEVKRENVNDV